MEDPLFGEIPAHHGYPVGVIALFLRLIQLGIPLRAASRVLGFIAQSLGLPFSAPDWTTGRAWLLRFGLAQLLATKGLGDDGVWLIDPSVQIGKEKVLAILGIRRVDLPMPERALRAEDLVLIALVPMSGSTREQVAERLEEVAKPAGVPCAIVDDHGVDLNGGVAIVPKDHPETVEIYDIRHKAAGLLTARLENDRRFMAFLAELARARCAIPQTDLGPLTPPASKPKARFMNLGAQLGWAGGVLRLLDGIPGTVPSWTTAERLEGKLGWLRGFRAELAQWRQWQELVDQAVEVVGREGLPAGTAAEVSRSLSAVEGGSEGHRLAEELLGFVAAQAALVKPGERLPGSTDELESCFGRFKALEKDHAKGGFTSLLLGFGSLFVEATLENVLSALRAVPTLWVKAWCSTHLGRTLQSKRIEALVHGARQKLPEPSG
jgi:hypothetical protein